MVIQLNVRPALVAIVKNLAGFGQVLWRSKLPLSKESAYFQRHAVLYKLH